MPANHAFDISPMAPAESEGTAQLFRDVVRTLTYYNDRAVREECAKYTPTELARSIEEDPHSVLLARSEGAIVGFCISKYDDGLVWLSWFGVRSDHRGRGVGRALLDAVATTLAARNAHKVWCDTRTENLRSQRVLRDAGFRRITEVRNHWYGQDFLLWEWYPR